MNSENLPRILIAEDGEINQKLLGHLLRRLNFDYDLVENGEKVISALEESYYDIILMDLYMPVMDGFTAARLISEKFSSGKRPFIVAVTANNEAEDREACISAGMEDFLIKPVMADDLKRIIANWQNTTNKR